VRGIRFVAGTVTLLGVFGAGLLGGLTAARQDTKGGGHGHAHGGEEEGHGHEAAPALSPRALANLGVTTGPAALGEHVRWIEVPAVVSHLPGSELPLTAPASGRVRLVAARPGAAVAGGQVLVEIVRDAYPPTALALTEAIVKPLNEDHHEAAVGVRTAGLAHQLARVERDRLRSALGPTPEASAARVLREAEAALQRAALELENARHEAERHGMTEAQIDVLARGQGDVEVPDGPDVRRVLQRNRLWSEQADRLLALLPASERSLPHTVAVLGELVGSARLTAQLVDAVAAQPALAERFLDAAGLVQQGLTPAALSDLASTGALEPVVRVAAPTRSAAGLDVAEVLVREGERVLAGQRLVLLRDDARMALALAPTPGDVAALEAALAAGTPLEARPLVPGAGPRLSGVRMLGMHGSEGAGAGTSLAVVDNHALAASPAPGDPVLRSWAVRPGARYGVRVPVETRSGRFVLPADAVAFRAAEAVVLLVDGSGFRPVPVRLEHHDAEVAVVAADGALFPGDQIVLHGAPALTMALLAGQGGNAGHGHAH
jgi:multidrug efflux pump subunit AcrA (membrane-fusion protein)